MSVSGRSLLRRSGPELYVAVIGAGIAGLVTAYVALKAGHHVQVLEHRNASYKKRAGADEAFGGSSSYRSFGVALPMEEMSDGHRLLVGLGVRGLDELVKELGVEGVSLIERRGRLMVKTGHTSRENQGAGWGQKTWDGVSGDFPVVTPTKIAPVILDTITAGLYDRESYDIRVGCLRDALIRRIEEMYEERGKQDRCIRYAARPYFAQRSVNDGMAEWALISADKRTTVAHVVINAAGPNADAVDGFLGVKPVGHAAKYRSMCLLPVPRDKRQVAATTPIIDVLDEDGKMRCFFKPVVVDENGNLDQTLIPGVDCLDGRDLYFQVSPGDERESIHPIGPDVDALDRAIDAVREVTGWDLPHAADVEQKYACPRVHTPDEFPRIGFHPDDPTVFECTGLAGSGFQAFAPVKAHVEAAFTGQRSSLPPELSKRLEANRFEGAKFPAPEVRNQTAHWFAEVRGSAGD